MLEKQLEVWHSYSRKVKEQLEFIVVDDGSPSTPAVISEAKLNLTLARVKVNIPWNHPGAQNLCAHLATGDWFWSGGIDHVFSKNNIEKLLAIDRTDLKVNYKIPRKRNGKVSYHWEINYLSREAFFSIGGYDEDFAGTWGADDVCFINMLKKTGVKEIPLPEETVCLDLYTEEDFPEANSHKYTDERDKWGPRKMNPTNKNLWRAKVAGRKPYGQNLLRFPWEIEKKFTI